MLVKGKNYIKCSVTFIRCITYIYIYVEYIYIHTINAMYMKSPFPLVKQHGKTKKQGSAWPPSAEKDPFGATRRTCRSVQAWDDVEKQAVAWFCSWENIIYKVEKKKRTSVYRNNIYKKNGKTISTKKWNLDVKRTSVYKICMFRVEKKHL